MEEGGPTELTNTLLPSSCLQEIDDSDDLDGDDDLKAGKPDADTPPQKKKFAAPAKKVEPSKTAGGRPPNGKIVQCDECGGKVTVVS